MFVSIIKDLADHSSPKPGECVGEIGTYFIYGDILYRRYLFSLESVVSLLIA